MTTTGKKAELLARLMEKHGYGAKDQAKAKERHDKHVKKMANEEAKHKGSNQRKRKLNAISMERGVTRKHERYSDGRKRKT